MDINLRLKELRENKKMTQVQLEKAIGKSRRMISFYEKGTNAPDYETIVKYAEYFKVSTDYLLGRVDDSNSYYIVGNAIPDVIKPFLKSSSAIMSTGKPIINATDEEKRKLTEELLKQVNVLDNKDKLTYLLSILPEEKRNQPISLYDLYYIIGNDKNLLNKVNVNDFQKSLEEDDLPPEALKELQNYKEYLKQKYN